MNSAIERLQQKISAKHYRLEADLQKAVVQLLAIYENQGKLTYFSVPNAGKRSRLHGYDMAQQGLRKGFPDMVVLVVNGPTILFELKSIKGKLSQHQEGWRAWATAAGYRWHLIRSITDVESALAEFVQKRAA
jgi:hypothetical protein